MNNSKTKKRLFVNILLCAASLFVSVIILSLIDRTDVFLILSDFWQTQFVPNKNTAVLQTNSQINLLLIYYIAISFLFLILCVVAKVKNKSLLNRFKIQMVIFTGIFIFSQSVSHINYFKTQVRKFGNRNIQQKIANNFNESYAFAQYCKNHLQGRHACQPITDIDMNPQQNLLTYLAVRYYLYPLNIVTHRSKIDFDCLIIFLKSDPQSHIPPLFTAKPSFDAESLIAIKKDIIQ